MKENLKVIGIVIAKIAITILMCWYQTSAHAQTIDSTKYWHNKYDSAATRYVQAKIALFNIQDCLDKIHARPKSFVYVSSWINRINDDLNHFYVTNHVTKPVLVHRKSTAPKKPATKK